MNFVSIARKTVSRRLQAVACLLAMTFLWAPLWANGGKGAANCNGMMCMAKGHDMTMAMATTPAPKPATDPSEDVGMHCDHESQSSAIKCSMSCCHTETRAFVASLTFDLPAAVVLSRPLPFAAPLFVSSENEIFSTVAPPDRPPRLMHS